MTVHPKSAFIEGWRNENAFFVEGSSIVSVVGDTINESYCLRISTQTPQFWINLSAVANVRRRVEFMVVCVVDDW